MGDGSTRREWLSRTLLTGAGAAAGLAATPEAARAATAVPSDSDTLTKVLEVERLVVLGYRQVLASGALAKGEDAVIEPFLAHELEHVSTVAAQLAALGAMSDTAPLDVKTGAALLGKYHVPGSLTDLHARADCLRLLVNLESVAEGAYFTALKTLGHAELVTLCAQIMGCEAQHWTVISGLRNPGIYVKSVPWPFVTGSS
ncbi:MAG TPA: ferritin-like domain-containing protein [Solirubrobacteraceae bacterium]|nr:ferritin-like domain-containing protein [Solirubrobacteraceae bacterium]